MTLQVGRLTRTVNNWYVKKEVIDAIRAETGKQDVSDECIAACLILGEPIGYISGDRLQVTQGAASSFRHAPAGWSGVLYRVSTI